MKTFYNVSVKPKCRKRTGLTYSSYMYPSVNFRRCASHNKLISWPLSFIRLLFTCKFIMIVTILGLWVSRIMVAEAMPAHGGHTNCFTIYALNANGMVNPGKLAHINSVLTIRRPHIFVISETKTNVRIADKLPIHEYNIYEEVGKPAENHHIFKWGIAVGVRKDIQVARRITISSQTLAGRVIALDLVIGTNSGKGFLHRVIGAYAPWNPGGDGNSYWNDIAKLCQEETISWSLAGDLNATVSHTERASGGNDARLHFSHFLQSTRGRDLWSEKPERTREMDWTCRARRSENAGNIIDRVVISPTGFIDAEIAVADRSHDYVPMTDHRAIIATLFPISLSDHRNEMVIRNDMPFLNKNSQPRIKYPARRDKGKFDEYRERVDLRIQQLKLQDDDIRQKKSLELHGHR
ncbi:hypothetical protein BDQ12DRAFT_262093 [Crucibulum laeve]|uniref:Endonuclease/exonuclease/phosphatase n=1 Tax=Crucibulum laeve TaxID=68775 RepID=A0A5C3LV30_9AGAR|nr:hypothetical protein BDQ12DRAFT_262093 [Crucibulum laeve]